MICCSSMDNCCSLLGGAGGWGDASAMLRFVRRVEMSPCVRVDRRELSAVRASPALALGGARELGYSDALVRGSENSCSHAFVIELATRRAAVSLPTPAQSSALELEL